RFNELPSHQRTGRIPPKDEMQVRFLPGALTAARTGVPTALIRPSARVRLPTQQPRGAGHLGVSRFLQSRRAGFDSQAPYRENAAVAKMANAPGREPGVHSEHESSILSGRTNDFSHEAHSLGWRN